MKKILLMSLSIFCCASTLLGNQKQQLARARQQAQKKQQEQGEAQAPSAHQIRLEAKLARLAKQRRKKN